jgi:hypothetical protein
MTLSLCLPNVMHAVSMAIPEQCLTIDSALLLPRHGDGNHGA